jgi:hypothetical protein
MDAVTELDNPRGLAWVFGEMELPTGVQAGPYTPSLLSSS